MENLLHFCENLPLVQFEAGEIVVHEGGVAGGIWVLVSGGLLVRKGAVEVNAVTSPGALIGEISLLLGKTYSATVEATGPTVMRHARDGQTFLDSNPAVTRMVAVELAVRLHFMTSYLADLKQQYGAAPGLTMVADVLRELTHRQVPAARPGSARDPNPDY